MIECNSLHLWLLVKHDLSIILGHIDFVLTIRKISKLIISPGIPVINAPPRSFENCSKRYANFFLNVKKELRFTVRRYFYISTSTHGTSLLLFIFYVMFTQAKIMSYVHLYRWCTNTLYNLLSNIHSQSISTI